MDRVPSDILGARMLRSAGMVVDDKLKKARRKGWT